MFGSGRSVIYADMWAAVLSDVPKALLASFLATLLVVVIAFRGGKSSAIVIASLLAGECLLLGLLSLGQVKLNFLNSHRAAAHVRHQRRLCVVNIMERYREGVRAARSPRFARRGARWCSVRGHAARPFCPWPAPRTTRFGAWESRRCRGGDVLLAAVLLPPAALTWLDARRARRTKADAP
ncbi:MAG: hypothetical protein U0441_30015 [Polyangiaceae bacterium]